MPANQDDVVIKVVANTASAMQALDKAILAASSLEQRIANIGKAVMAPSPGASNPVAAGSQSVRAFTEAQQSMSKALTARKGQYTAEERIAIEKTKSAERAALMDKALENKIAGLKAQVSAAEQKAALKRIKSAEEEVAQLDKEATARKMRTDRYYNNLGSQYMSANRQVALGRSDQRSANAADFRASERAAADIARRQAALDRAHGLALSENERRINASLADQRRANAADFRSSNRAGLEQERMSPNSPANMNKRGSAIMAMNRRDSGSEPVVENVFRRALLFGAVSAGIFKAVQAGQAFFDTMVKMDKQLADLRKTLGGTDEDFGRLMKSATSIARTYKGSTQDVLDAMELFSAQFKRPADLEKLSKSAVLFSNLSGQGLKTTAETLTSTIQQYNMAASDSERITDSWANVAANSAVTIGDLGDAMGAAGGAAVTAGIDFDKFNSLVATVATSTGKSGKEIGNALKRIFERYTADDNAKRLSELGIFVKKANGEFRDFDNVLADVAQGWEKNTDSEKKNIAVAFAGARQYDSFLAIMNHYGKTLELTTVSQDSFGAAQRQNERIAETFSKKVQGLTVEYDSLARATGEGLLPAFGKVVTVMTTMLRIFNEMPGAIKTVALAMATITGGSFAASGILKILGTNRSDAGLVNPRRDLLGRMAAPFIGPTMFNPGGQGGVSVFGGIGRSLGVGAAGSGGTGAAIASFTAGLGAVTAALLALAGIAWGLYKIWDMMRFKGEDLIRSQGELVDKMRQDVTATLQLAERGKTIEKQRSGLKGFELQEFDRNVTTGFLADVSATNPDLIKKLGISFDRMGRVVDLVEGKLGSLSIALEEAANSAETNALRAATISQTKLIEEGDKLLNAIPGTRNGKFAKTSGGQNPVVEYIDASFLIPARDELVRRRFDFGNMTDQSIAGNKDVLEASLGPLSKDAAEAIMKFIAYTLNAQAEISRSPAFGGKIAEEAARNGFASSEKMRRAINTSEIGIPTDFLSSEQAIQLFGILPANNRGKKPNDTGVPFGIGGKNRIKPQNLDITRIDFELQKSLMSNSRNFAEFGGEVKLVENAIQAYKSALSDLNNETQKAAGPQEELAMLAIQGQIANHQEKIANIQKEETNPALKEQRVLAEQLQIAALQEKQAIQQTNAERERGKAIIRDQLQQLIIIRDIQESIRGPLAGAINSLLPNQGIRNAALGQQNIIGESGRGTLEAKRIFAQMKMDRAMQVQAMNGTANTPGGRNELKHIREEMAAIDDEMSDVLRKTDVWNNLLKNIGDTFMNRITGRLVDNLMEEFGKATGGDSIDGSFTLFGQANPQVNALNINTAALQSLTAALMAANVTAAGGHLADTFALASTGSNFDALMATGGIGAAGALMADRRTDADRWLNGSTDGWLGGAGASFASSAAGGAPGGIKKPNNLNWGQAAGGAVVGLGVGSAMTQGQNRTGNMGAVGGAIGGALGSTVGAAYGGAIWGPIVGGFIGSLFDKPIDAKVPELDELDGAIDELTYEMLSLEKALNTVNETMENLINAPSNFMLPIPRGILENSITAQSAIAVPLQAGGLIMKSGPAFLHAGERVVNGSSESGGGINQISATFHIQGATNPQEVADEVMKKMNDMNREQMQRTGNYRQRF